MQLVSDFSRQQAIKSTASEPEDGIMGSFDFLQRNRQEEAEEEMDDGGNADDELDEREVDVNRLSLKRVKQGMFVRSNIFAEKFVCFLQSIH